MRFKFWYLEAFLVVLFFVVSSGIPFNPPPKNPDFVPNAVNGLATMSGIMTALIVYLITYIIPRIPDTPREWIGIRIVMILFSIAFGLTFVMIGLSELVLGSVQWPYNSALFGTFLLVLGFLELMFMVIFTEVEQITNLSDTF